MSIDQAIFNWSLAVISMLMGVVLKAIWDAVRALRADMRQIERDLPDLYVRKDDWRDSIHGLKEDMQRGFDKLDQTIQAIFKRIDLRVGEKNQ